MALTLSEVAKHATEDDCWVIVGDRVLDITQFLEEHPGGKRILLQWAGKDATRAFLTFHNTDVLDIDSSIKVLGRLQKPQTAGTTSKQKQSAALPEELRSDLRRVVGDPRCVEDPLALRGYGEDLSCNKGVAPSLAVLPKTTDEVQKIVKLCRSHRIPLVPVGRGTSLEGNAIPIQAPSVVLNMKKMNKIIAIHANDLDVVVQPGLTYDDLNLALRPYGLFFPVDPGPGAMLGGMVATNCSGPAAVRYGTMKHCVLSLQVVLPDGTAVRTAQRARKTSAGYDLTSLFVGSEGTLGVITEITVKVFPRPSAAAVCRACFASVKAAASAVTSVMQAGFQVGKVGLPSFGCIITSGKAELVDASTVHAINLAEDMDFEEKATLIFEFAGALRPVTEMRNQAEGVLRKLGGTSIVCVTDERAREELWRMRKVALLSCKTLRPTAKVLITDVAVPLGEFANCIEETLRDVSDSFLQAPLVGHAGDGNFHLFILVDLESERERKEAQRINERLVRRAIRMGGTCTGEHGVGLGKKKYLERELGEGAVELMRKLKRTLDPLNLMNPGKVVDIALERPRARL